MKRLLFIFSIALLGMHVLSAQNSPFTLTTAFYNLNADQGKVLAFVNNLPRNGTIQYINWTSENIVNEDGKITVSLPDENNGQSLTFDVLDAFYASTTKYAVFGRSSLGNIAVYITPEGMGGTIDLGINSYSLYPLGGSKGLMIQNSSPGYEPADCRSESSNPNMEFEGYCDIDCGANVLDVVAMVTPGAQSYVDEYFGAMGDYFLFTETHNINGALVNSIVPNKRVRVRIVNYSPSYDLSDDMDADVENFKNDAQAMLLAQQMGGDIRVLLTRQPYQFFGVIPLEQLDPLTTNKVAIVQVSTIGSIRYTFAHELAHHFGCRHAAAPGCPNGKNLSNGRNTIMASAANNTRIQHFSNPDVFFAGVSTGTLNTKDNAAQIRGALCEVANNNTPMTLTVDFDNSPACPYSPFSAEAWVEDGWLSTLSGEQWCTGPYNYQWQWSDNPNFTNPHNIGTNSSILNLSGPPRCPFFYLRVIATNAIGCSASHTRLINCQTQGCERSTEPKTSPDLAVNRIIPNPANDQIKVLLDGVGQISKVVAVGTTGKARDVTYYLGEGQNEVICNVSGFEPGLWYLKVQGSEKNLALKFVIVH